MQHARATDGRHKKRRKKSETRGRGEPHKQASGSSVWWNRDPPSMNTLENRNRLYNEKLWTVRSHTRRNHRIASVPLPCHFVPQYFRVSVPLNVLDDEARVWTRATVQYHCTTRGPKTPAPNELWPALVFACPFCTPFSALHNKFCKKPRNPVFNVLQFF